MTKSPDGGLIALCCLSRSPSTEAKPSRSKKRWSAGEAGVHGVAEEEDEEEDVVPVFTSLALPPEHTDTMVIATTATGWILSRPMATR